MGTAVRAGIKLESHSSIAVRLMLVTCCRLPQAFRAWCWTGFLRTLSFSSQHKITICHTGILCGLCYPRR